MFSPGFRLLFVELVDRFGVHLGDDWSSQFQCWTEFTARYGEVPGKDGPLLDLLGSGDGLGVGSVDSVLDCLEELLVMVVQDLRDCCGIASYSFAPV